MCHSSSVSFEERPSDSTRTERFAASEPRHTSHSHVSAHSASRIFPCARMYISQQPPFCLATTSKNRISHLLILSWHLRRHLHSRIFGDAPETWQWRNWQASGAPNKPHCLSIFRRSRARCHQVFTDVCAGFIFYLSDSRASWELQPPSFRRLAAVSRGVNLTSRNCRCDVSHKSWYRLARKHLLWKLKRVSIKLSARNLQLKLTEKRSYKYTFLVR